MKPKYAAEFKAELIQFPGKGGWTFAPVSEEFAPQSTHGWGCTPVRATVDGHTWDTSVWREESGRTLLPVPKKVRGTKGRADSVRVCIEFTVL